MTATTTESASSDKTGAVGRITLIPGTAIASEFPAHAMPEIYNALTVELTLNRKTSTVTFETAQHLGENLVRAIAMEATDGLVRGQEVVDTGAPITVPVGDVVNGHIFIALVDSLVIDINALDVQDR